MEIISVSNNRKHLERSGITYKVRNNAKKFIYKLIKCVITYLRLLLKNGQYVINSAGCLYTAIFFTCNQIQLMKNL